MPGRRHFRTIICRKVTLDRSPPNFYSAAGTRQICGSGDTLGDYLEGSLRALRLAVLNHGRNKLWPAEKLNGSTIREASALSPRNPDRTSSCIIPRFRAP